MLKKQKRVVAIHDISCVGKCSLTVALPILSAAGAETSIIPVSYTHLGFEAKKKHAIAIMESKRMWRSTFNTGAAGRYAEE